MRKSKRASWRVGFDRQGVQFIAGDLLLNCGHDQFVPLYQRLACKRIANHDSLEMTTVAGNVDLGARKPGFDERFDFTGFQLCSRSNSPKWI